MRPNATKSRRRSRTLASLVDDSKCARWTLATPTRSQLLRATRLLRRLADAIPADSPQAAAARNAAAWANRFVELSIAPPADTSIDEAKEAEAKRVLAPLGVSQETASGRERALPPGDRP